MFTVYGCRYPGAYKTVKVLCICMMVTPQIFCELVRNCFVQSAAAQKEGDINEIYFSETNKDENIF